MTARQRRAEEEFHARMKERGEWAEARVVSMPVKDPAEPRVLVERRRSQLIGPRGEEILYLPGEPCISLFTGAGGFDIGVERAGFCVLAQHEWDESCCHTLIHNRPAFFRHAALIQGDIRITPTSMILGAAGLRVGETALVIGGPPCQGFSTSNVHAWKNGYDDRNDLVFQYLRFIDEARPRHFSFENVPGFLHFKGLIDGMTYVETFMRAAYDSYYELVYGLVDAVEYGVPQHRVRFICMGTRRDVWEIEGRLASLPEPICFSETDLTTIRVLEGGLFQHEVELLRHAPGIRYFPDRPFITPPSPTNNTISTLGRSRSFVDFYRKLEMEEPDRIVRRPLSGSAD